MKPEPCTPFEVLSVLELRPDYDLAVRCLEYIRQNFSLIVPERAKLHVRLLSDCHHHASNIYPALASVVTDTVYPAFTYDEIENFTKKIDAWVEAQSLPVLVSKARQIKAPSWAQLKESGQL